MVKLQVLITAYGSAALENIASLSHPIHENVEYLVSWQNYDKTRIPDILKNRKDFKIFYLNSTGVSNNRNNLIRKSNAPYLLCSDDDISYTIENLNSVISEMELNSSYGILTFEFESQKAKNYPDCPFDLQKPAKGYFIGAPEIAFNVSNISESVKTSDFKFHEDFGINGKIFSSGEEDLIIASLLRKGYKGRFIPKVICRHNDIMTTCDKIGHTREFIETKGAILLYIKPWTWIARMIMHAMREKLSRDPGRVSFFRYCLWWLSGVSKAKRHKVFTNY